MPSKIDDRTVTFRYRENRTQAIRHATVTGVEFLSRFLPHVLPRRFIKVRYVGLWSRTRRHDLDRAREHLDASGAPPPAVTPPAQPSPRPAAPSCPLCHAGTLTLIVILRRQPLVPP